MQLEHTTHMEMPNSNQEKGTVLKFTFILAFFSLQNSV